MNKILLLILTIFSVLLLPLALAFTASDVVSYYTFDAVTTDEKGTYDLTNSGATSGVTGILNTSYSYIANDYMYDTTDGLISHTSGSVSVWVKFDAVDGNYAVFSYGAAASQFIITLRGASNTIQIYCLEGTQQWNAHTSGTFTASTDTWYHIVFTYNETGAVKTLYINGATKALSYLGGASNTAFWWNDINAGAAIVYGRRENNDFYLNGDIDEAGIWSKTLTQSEVTELYNSGAGLSYDLNPSTPSGSSLNDANKTGETLTVTGAGGIIDNDILHNGDTDGYLYEFRCSASDGTIIQPKSTTASWVINSSCGSLETVYINIYRYQGTTGNNESISYETETREIINSTSRWQFNDSNFYGLVNNSGGIKDYYEISNGTLYGKTFNHGTNNGATSNYNLTGAITGATWNGTTLEFDGVDDYVLVSDNNNIDVSDNFTFSLYSKQSEYIKKSGLIDKYKTSDGYRSYRLYIIDTNELGLSLSGDGITYDDIKTTNNCGFTENDKWAMFQVTFNAGNVSFYKNGDLCYSEISTVTSIYNSLQDLKIGKRTTSSIEFNGSISDVIILDIALNSTEVLNLYNSGNINTTGYYHEINFPLNEGSGSTVYTDDNTKFGGNYEFDGVSDYIELSSIEEISPYSDFSIQLQFKTSILNSNDYLFSQYLNSSDRFSISVENNRVRTSLYNGVAHVGRLASDALVANTSYSIGITWDHDLNIYKMYLDGIEQIAIAQADPSSSSGTTIGVRSDLAGYFNGSIDEVKIWNRALTQTEIQEEMNANSVANPEGIVAYYDFNEKVGETDSTIFDNNHLTTGVLQSTLEIDNPIFQYDKSISFDGVDDYINLGANHDEWWKNNITTISAWVYPLDTGIGYIMASREDNKGAYSVYIGSGNVYSVRGTYGQTGVAGLTVNEWNHVVVVFNDTFNVDTYINGVLEYHDTTLFIANWDPSDSVYLGFREAGSGSHHFNGSIADVRIYDEALNDSQIKALYRATSTINFTVENMLPSTSNYTNENWIYGEYNITNDLNYNTNITINLYKDGAYNQSYTENDTLYAEHNFTITADGNYTIFATAEDISQDYNSTIYWLYRDTSKPVILLSNPLADNSTTNLNITNVSIDFNLADDRDLFGYNITCNNGAYSVQNLTLTGTSQDINLSHLFTTIGQNNCTITVADSHTDTDFEATVKVKNLFLGFGEQSIEVNRAIKIKYDSDNELKLDSISYEKTKDRISPIFNFKDEPLLVDTDVSYTVEYTGEVYEIESEYEGHVVICPDSDLRNCYWYDAEDMYGTFKNYTIDVENKEIKYIHNIKKDLGIVQLKTKSLGGLNTAETDFNFEILTGNSITFNAYNIWNSSNISFNVYFNGTLNTTTDDITYNLSCRDLNITINNSEYMNDYSYNGDICDLNSSYNNSFYQAIVTINARENASNNLILNSIIHINDSSTTNYSTTATGSKIFYISTGTFSMNASNPFHNDSLINVSTFTFNTSNTIDVIMNYNGTLTISAYDASTLVIIDDDNINIDLLNEDNGYSKSYTAATPTGIVGIIDFPDTETRITSYGTNFNTNILYYTLPNTTQNHVLSIYLANATSTSIIDIILEVRNEVDDPKPDVEVRIYRQNGTNYDLIATPITNYNGQVLARLVKETVYYKFTGYSSGVKCFDTNSYTILDSDEKFIFDCLIGTNFIEEYAEVENVQYTFASVNSTNTTGYFSLEAVADSTSNYCVKVYQQPYTVNSLYGSNCTNGTSAILRVNVNGSSGETYRGVFEFKGILGDSLTPMQTKYLEFSNTSFPSWGNFGILFVIIVLIAIVMIFASEPAIQVLAITMILALSIYIEVIKVTGNSKILSIMGIIVIGGIMAWFVETRFK